jgi:ribosomal biogenesis protein LAS1
MVQYVITPWRTRAELLHVRSILYPQAGESVTEEQKRNAVAKVGVWMQRGNCPHLVESSAVLWSAVLNDGVGNSTYCVRAAYAAAFCR